MEEPEVLARLVAEAASPYIGLTNTGVGFVSTDAAPLAEVLATCNLIGLCGESGSGKTFACARAGQPVLHLDGFYRSPDESGLPIDSGGGVDWESIASFDVTAAAAAVHSLLDHGVALVPVFDYRANGFVGEHLLRVNRGLPLIAEGLFALEVVRLVSDDRKDCVVASVLLNASTHRAVIGRVRRDVREGRRRLKDAAVNSVRMRARSREYVLEHQASGDFAVTRSELRHLLRTLYAEIAP